MRKFLLILFMTGFMLQLQGQGRIRGNVCYANQNLTYLDSVTVFLKQGGLVINQTTTNAQGFFEFTGVANGTYTISGSCVKAWGGGSSADALAIMQHLVQLTPLTGFKLVAANVDNNAHVNSLDALMASRRYLQLLSAFPAGDWVVEEKTVQVTGQTVHKLLKATCIGDVNSSFSPPALFTCGNNLVDTRDNQVYPTVLIGEQCWMSKNLNVGTFIYGVGNQTNNYVIEKFCYQNNLANCNTFGGLYQWDELMQYDTSPGVQGICPANFHVPTDQEWDTLVYALGGNAVAGAALKLGGSSGFDALLAGWVIDCQKFRLMGTQAIFWSATPYYNIYAYDRVLAWNSSTVVRNYTNQENGVSVRCVKD